MTGAVAAADRLTANASWCVPLLPSVTDASATDRVGRGGGGGAVPTAVPLILKPAAVLPALVSVAWKPNEVAWLAPTWPFQLALLTI